MRQDNPSVDKIRRSFGKIFNTKDFEIREMLDAYGNTIHEVVCEGLVFQCAPFLASTSFYLNRTCPQCGEDFLVKTNKLEDLGCALECDLCRECEKKTCS